MLCLLVRFAGEDITRCYIRFIFLDGLPRSNEMLTLLIDSYVLPGTKIITDGWAGYQGPITLEQLGFEHAFVNHNENFVHPENPEVHTQTVEGEWKHFREAFPPGGVKGGVEEHWLYAAAHLYRKRLKHDPEFRGVCRIKTFMRHLALWHDHGMPDVFL